MQPSNIAFPGALEKEPHNEDLQPGHCDHHDALDNAEVENPPLSAAHCTEIAVFSCAKVFLVAVDSGELRAKLDDRLLQRGLLVWR